MKPTRPISETDPEAVQMMEDPSLADLISRGSSKKIGWVCPLGHVWSASPNNFFKGQSCAVCAGRQVVVGVNDLATTHPEIYAMMVEPKPVTRGSNKKELWRCEFGHVWSAAVNNMVGGQGCGVCSGRVVVAGVNDLATTRPDIAAQLVDRSFATTVTSGSNRVAEFRCQQGHVTKSPICRRSAGHGCPVRSGAAVIAGSNDLATTHPDLAAQLVDPNDGSRVSFGSNRKLRWRCSDGHEWMATPNSRSQGKGCAQCDARFLVVGVNDLATTNPALAAELADPSLATELTQGSDRRVQWRCAQGHGWVATPYDRRLTGCPSCAVTGFQPSSSEAILYLVDAGHSFIHGVVVSQKRLDVALSGPYRGMRLIAKTAPNNGVVVKAAELALGGYADRPAGVSPRSFKESNWHERATIDRFVDVSAGFGLEVEFAVDVTEISFAGKPLRKQTQSATCLHDGNVHLNDSSAECCRRNRSTAFDLLTKHHYLHSPGATPVHVFTAIEDDEVTGVIVLGAGSSPSVSRGMSGVSGYRSLELTRMWIAEDSEIIPSSFMRQCFAMLDYPLYVYSYADAAQGHVGTSYLAAGFNYAGWSDMKRSEPLRRKVNDGDGWEDWAVASPKHRYWVALGARSDRKRMLKLVPESWSAYDHRILGFSPEAGHRRVSAKELKAAKIPPR